MAVNLGLGSLAAEQRMTEKPKCRILVVEDEAMIAMLVEEMVLDFGSEVVALLLKWRRLFALHPTPASIPRSWM